MTNWQYIFKELSDCLNIFHTFRHQQKLLTDFVGCDHAWYDAPKLLQITNRQYLLKEMSDCLNTFHTVRHC